jgi:glycosyltransferase involved in cell wall biosynthesis
VKRREPAEHRDGRAARQLIVVESAPAIRPTTNPYIVQLFESLRSRPGLDVRLFSFRRAILGRYDVFHVHWPEAMLTANTAPKRWRRRILVGLFLARIRLTRTAVVRTWHNLDRPDGLGRVDTALLDLVDRVTTLRIALNPLTTFADDKPAMVIPHGHYRDWYLPSPGSAAIPGRVSYVGLIRRYKGVENLVRSFRKLERQEATLHVSGRPSTPELQDGLTELAAGDERITFDFRFLSDPDFARAITEAELVVLPYRHMHNSGVALAVLSLDRPALVPDNEMNRLLADEVGTGWLHFFEGELDTPALARALDDLASAPPEGRPNLERRAWAAAGEAHEKAFRRAVALTQGKSR